MGIARTKIMVSAKIIINAFFFFSPLFMLSLFYSGVGVLYFQPLLV
jgi:hypothetical protein